MVSEVPSTSEVLTFPRAIMAKPCYRPVVGQEERRDGAMGER